MQNFWKNFVKKIICMSSIIIKLKINYFDFLELNAYINTK